MFLEVDHAQFQWLIRETEGPIQDLWTKTRVLVYYRPVMYGMPTLRPLARTEPIPAVEFCHYTAIADATTGLRLTPQAHAKLRGGLD